MMADARAREAEAKAQAKAQQAQPETALEKVLKVVGTLCRIAGVW